MTMTVSDTSETPESAYAQHVRKWMNAHAAEGERRFTAEVSGAELELSILDVIGYDFWTGSGVTSKMVKHALDAHPDVTLIRVLLDSPGGSVFDGVAIHNLFKRSSAQVEIEVIGEASSAASVVAMSGNNIKMHEGTTMMIHRASCCCCGFADDMMVAADALNTITSSITDIYETRSGRSRADIEAMVKKETWMSAADAVKEGFADEVVKAGSKPVPATAKGKPKATATSEETQTLHLDFDTSALDVTADKLRAAADALLAVQASAPVASSLGATPPSTEETIAPAGAPATPTTAPEAQPTEDKTMSETMTTLRALLGLGAGTPDSDVIAAATRLRELERAAMTATGAKSTEEAIGGISAIKAKADKSDAMAEELTQVKADRDKQNFDTLIANGQTVPAKLTPAMANDWRAHFDAAVAEGNGSREVERLKGFLKNAAVVIAGSVKQPRAGTTGSFEEAPALLHDGKSYEQLSYAMRARLKTEQPELWTLMHDDWERRGKPAAKAA